MVILRIDVKAVSPFGRDRDDVRVYEPQRAEPNHYEHQSLDKLEKRDEAQGHDRQWSRSSARPGRCWWPGLGLLRHARRLGHWRSGGGLAARPAFKVLAPSAVPHSITCSAVPLQSAARFNPFREFANGRAAGLVGDLVPDANDKSHRPLDYLQPRHQREADIPGQPLRCRLGKGRAPGLRSWAFPGARRWNTPIGPRPRPDRRGGDLQLCSRRRHVAQCIMRIGATSRRLLLQQMVSGILKPLVPCR